MAEDHGGAGRGGGLLFAAVVAFLGYLAVTSVLGALRWVLSTALLVLVGWLVVRVVSRR